MWYCRKCKSSYADRENRIPTTCGICAGSEWTENDPQISPEEKKPKTSKGKK